MLFLIGKAGFPSVDDDSAADNVTVIARKRRIDMSALQFGGCVMSSVALCSFLYPFQVCSSIHLRDPGSLS